MGKLLKQSELSSQAFFGVACADVVLGFGERDYQIPFAGRHARV